MKYVKNRHKPAHEWDPATHFCRACGWARQFVVDRRAKRCPVALQQKQAQRRQP